ncbi:hypothetical protein THF1C08_60085 [Vibrio jasicida]|uniref:Uncharacterized protein n=1 Tax=Vibrio jasicida TaxID=766224 RepID=A0AAU9QQ37_9VIBR|nr:hypothetical protein THF1A12_30150 [Vibrio jasicida]CAH1600295.1 hypothetical protein THF1C08_60085 [Vibrio jasicida]
MTAKEIPRHELFLDLTIIAVYWKTTLFITLKTSKKIKTNQCQTNVSPSLTF